MIILWKGFGLCERCGSERHCEATGVDLETIRQNSYPISHWKLVCVSCGLTGRFVMVFGGDFVLAPYAVPSITDTPLTSPPG